jgi:hypothetical protein
MNEPICAACHPPRLADIDPTAATIHLCAEHQADYDDHAARTRLASLLQPRQPYATSWL